MSTTPAGWYEDPSGSHQLRYWDGSLWTQYASTDGKQVVAPISPHAPPPSAWHPDEPTMATPVAHESGPGFIPSSDPATEALPYTAQASPRRRWYRGWPALVIAAAIVLVVAGSVVVAIVANDDHVDSVAAGPTTTIDRCDSTPNPARCRRIRAGLGTEDTSPTTEYIPPTTEYIPPTTAAPAIGTRTNPIPLGQPGEIPDPHWRIRVLGTTSNANAAIAEENQFNDPPASGRQFFMARVELTYLGPGSETTISVGLKALGGSSVAYGSFSDSCGVTPDDYSQPNDIFTGGTVQGNACWSVRIEDVSSLVMFADRLFGGEDSTWFALR